MKHLKKFNEGIDGLEYPTIEEIEAADHDLICRWYRFLPSPDTQEQVESMKLINQRFKDGGGFTEFLSKKIGW